MMRANPQAGPGGGIHLPCKLSPYEFTLFSRFIEERTGIEIRQTKSYLIETRLSRLLDEGGFGSFQQLYCAMLADKSGALGERVIDAITTNETFWFRDRMPWRYLEREQLPRFVAELRSGRRNRVRIWSAAAATGQEAYSTAMAIDRYLRVNRIADVSLSQFEILATDISPTVLARARMGRYDEIAITRGLDEDFRARYFHREENGYLLDDRIRRTVTFRKFNLQNSFMPLGVFDVVFLRYVMIYFSEPMRQDIARKLQSAIHAGGVLFLGASELYKCISSVFATQYFERSLVYVRS